MATKTPRFSFWKPTIDGDEGKWGIYTNTNWDVLDSVLIQEPLDDGQTYGRINTGDYQYWTLINPGSGIPEAPPSGEVYVRDGLNKIWVIGITRTEFEDHITDFDNPHQTSLGNLTDVDIATNPLLEGQGIWYDADTGLWKNRAAYEESFPTGLADGGELNIGPGANDIEAIAGIGVILDAYTEPLAPPVSKAVVWDQINEPITAAPAAAGSVVWFSIAATATPSVPPEYGGVPAFVGQMKQYAQGPNPSLSRKEVFLGVAIHNGVEWKEVSNPKVVNQSVETLRELLVNVLPLSHIIQGGQTFSQSTFELRQDAGTIWENNRNWHVDKSDPNREALPASNPITFQYVNRDFTDVGGPTTTVDPSQWDDGGVVSPVGGAANQATIQRLYIDPANNYWMLWGQNIYPNFLTALASVTADDANTTTPYILQNSILLGHAIMEHTKPDWDIDEAVWIPSDTTNSGGSGGTPITDHDNLNGITPDNHHRQLHKLYGLDGDGINQHTDVDITDALETRDLLAIPSSGSLFKPETRMNWRNTWQPLTYYIHDVVYESGYTMVANKTTTDNAAPLPLGAPAWALPEAPVWGNFSNTSVVYSGHQYTFNETVEFKGIRVWVPTLSADTNYRFVIVTNPNSPDPTYQTIEEPVLNENDWTVLGVSSDLVAAGTELIIYIDALNSGGTTVVNGGWRYDGIDNNLNPAPQGWNANQQNTLVRIDDFDLDSVDRSTELLGIVAGSSIQFVDTLDPDRSVTYRVSADPTQPAGAGTPIHYVVTLIDQGSLGFPAIGNTTTMRAEVPVPQPTDFVGIVDGWVGNQPVWGTVESFLQYNGVTQPVGVNNQYGVDVLVQRLSISPDWDVLSLPSGAGGGGSFTPDVFAGAGTTGYVPDPVTETKRHLSDDGTWQFTDYGDITNPPVIPTTYWTANGNNIYNNNTGFVGIGTSSPLEKLHVNAGTSGNAAAIGGVDGAIIEHAAGRTGGLILNSPDDRGFGIFFTDSGGYRGQVKYDHATDHMQFDTSATERMRITSAGNVGIGTSSPAKKLHTVGQLYLQGHAAANYVLQGDLANNYCYFFANTSATTNNGYVFKQGEVTIYNMGGTLHSWNTSGSERMRITSVGDVGIGTTNPSEKLHVAAVGTGVERIKIGVGTTTPDLRELVLEANYYDGIAKIIATGTAGNTLTFWTDPNTGATERMRINASNGYVGIGTTAPNSHLTVGDPLQGSAAGAGNVNISGAYHVNGVPIESFTDAPADGNTYGRNNNNWVQVSGGGGTISDLASSPATTQVTITNTGGANATILSATVSRAGVMTITQVGELDTAYDHTFLTNNPHSVTLAQLGYTGDTDANNYIHPNFTTRSISMSGATVPLAFTSNDEGHVTGFSTRTMTPSDIGAYTEAETDAAIAAQVPYTAAGVANVTVTGVSITGTVVWAVIGNLVTVTGTVSWTAAGVGTSAVSIANLPFTSDYATGFAMGTNNVRNTDSQRMGIRGRVTAGANFIEVWRMQGQSANVRITADKLAANGSMDINFSYYSTAANPP